MDQSIKTNIKIGFEWIRKWSVWLRHDHQECSINWNWTFINVIILNTNNGRAIKPRLCPHIKVGNFVQHPENFLFWTIWSTCDLRHYVQSFSPGYCPLFLGYGRECSFLLLLERLRGKMFKLIGNLEWSQYILNIPG